MNNITVNFTYDIADDQYYQTNDLKQTATLAYHGPEKIYIVVDAQTNNPTGSQIDSDRHQTFNDVDTRFYSVEVDCTTNPLLCSFYNGSIDPDSLEQLSEEIQESIPYVRPNPPIPDHTYELREIVMDRSTGDMVRPLPWKKPHLTWADRITWRNNALRNTDRQMSEDLPEALYNKMLAHREYLRNFTETFGAAWTVTVTSGGSGYNVGDKLLISDPRPKAGQAVGDIMVTVTEVNAGAITGIKPGERLALHYPGAATVADVFFTTNGTGTGASLTLSKVKTVDPWKITPKDSPLG